MSTAEPPLVTEVRIPNKLLVTTKKKQQTKLQVLPVWFFLVELFGQCKHFRISIRNALTTFTSCFGVFFLMVCFQLEPKMSETPKEPRFSFDINMEDSFSVPPPLY